MYRFNVLIILLVICLQSISGTLIVINKYAQITAAIKIISCSMIISLLTASFLMITHLLKKYHIVEYKELKVNIHAFF